MNALIKRFFALIFSILLCIMTYLVQAESYNKVHIQVDSNKQILNVIKDDLIIKSYLISTAKNGLGEEQGSFKTPRGKHRIIKKIGYDAPINTVFVGRLPTGEVYSPELEKIKPNNDWILTRIMWLDGLESGRNKGGNKDSMQRYIYIHGTPSSNVMGEPDSKGCIRMHNSDLLELFDLVEEGIEINIF